MKILSIETSCDETALSLLQVTENTTGIHFSVLANITHSQVDVHREFGGVFPKMAKREHQINLPIVLEQIMTGQEIPDYVCVTSGPGLEPALWTGIVFAQELGTKWNIPVIPVNHMEGHIVSVLVPETGSSDFVIKKDDLKFPALALLISGGHTELVLVRGIGDYEIIGKTRDDAVGEAFDKVARILGLQYPGGPEIAKLASLFPPLPRGGVLNETKDGGVSTSAGTPQSLRDSSPSQGSKELHFPRPMIHTKDYDFSFSGLKTAVLYHVRDLPGPITKENTIAIAYEFQEAVTDVLIKKTRKAIEDFGIQTLIVGGGVSANIRIKESLTREISKLIPVENIHFPARELTGDNALMIGIAGYFKIKNNPGTVYNDIRAEGNLSF